MTASLSFDQIRLPPVCDTLREEVRAFLADEVSAGTFDPHKPNREDTDAPEFSRRVGARGWLGMTWPKKYGGHERSFLERYVVTEEMRVANAPTRRENSGASVSSRLGWCGSKVPAAISSARKARTSLRSCSHSGGRRIGSKRRAAVMVRLYAGKRLK